MFFLGIQLIISVLPKFLDSQVPIISLFFQLLLNQEKRLVYFTHIFLLAIYSILLLFFYQIVQLYS